MERPSKRETDNVGKEVRAILLERHSAQVG